MCMENELDRFNDENNMNLSHARWAPYNNISKLSQSKYIIKEMEDMITNNIPCVFSYYTCTIRINGTPVPRERYKRFAPTVRYPFLRLLIGSKFLMFFPFISKRYDSLRTRARLASA